MSKHDTHFFNVFSVVLGLLAAFAVLVFALARYVGKTEQSPTVLDDPLIAHTVTERLAPPVRIAVAGQDNTALTIAPVTATASAGAAMPVLETGAQVYENACQNCHGGGLAGAPKVGDGPAWQPRIAQGKPTLYKHAIEGFEGRTGKMPAKGGRTDISDELVRAAVDHMLEL